jgi:hypothetical protein
MVVLFHLLIFADSFFACGQQKSEDREQFNCFQENCDEVVRMESENQELVVESFPFEQSDLRDDNSIEGRRTHYSFTKVFQMFLHAGTFFSTK